MKKNTETKLEQGLKRKLKREAKESELANIKTDALALAQYCLGEIDELQDIIEDLKKEIVKLKNK